MVTKEQKPYTLAELKDKYIGKVGSNDRDKYEDILRREVVRITSESTTPEIHPNQTLRDKP